MKWRKLGQVFRTDNSSSWMKTHAQVPTVMNLGDTLRIFFSTRGEKGESRIGFLDVDAKNPLNIQYVHNKPILDLGDPGCFDEHGVMPSCIVPNPLDLSKSLLYYSGWSRRLEVPYSNLAGIAVTNDGVNFERLGKGPALTTTLFEPFSATSPFVVIGREEHTVYYSSGTSWLSINNKLEHTYNIKKATSRDGIHWNQLSDVCIEQNHLEEALTRPTILKVDQVLHMLFCYRGSKDFRGGNDSYKIGYAKSYDYENWERDDSQSGIGVSESGWDAKMVAYPYVVETQYGVYMFYNGDGFGISGFGVATLDF